MRVSRTIIFVDLSGFSAYLRKTDDDEAQRVLRQFRRVSRDLASEMGLGVRRNDTEELWTRTPYAV
ncbi:MAG: hypothetical protein EB138_01505 [Actinobacteria bacterium]|nr:hypothetical protein [Actinomycetota bacterium]